MYLVELGGRIADVILDVIVGVPFHLGQTTCSRKQLGRRREVNARAATSIGGPESISQSSTSGEVLLVGSNRRNLVGVHGGSMAVREVAKECGRLGTETTLAAAVN
jgi:hypothetical protein